MKIFLIMLCLALISGCAKVEGAIPQERVVAVVTQEAEDAEQDLILSYSGVADYEEKLNYSFKTTDRLAELFVTEGQRVNKGDVLARINTDDLMLTVTYLESQVSSASAGIDNALAQIKSAEIAAEIANENKKALAAQKDKALNGATEESINRAASDVGLAKKVYDKSKETLDDVTILYSAGAVSKNELEQAEIRFKEADSNYFKATEGLKEIKNGTRKEDIDAAKAQLDAAALQYENTLSLKEQANALLTDARAKHESALAQLERQKKLLEDGVIYAEQDGYVLKTPFKVSEIVPAGSPVVITRNERCVVKIGVTAGDLGKIKLGDSAVIKTNDTSASGYVCDISELIDFDTRTYEVEIEPSEAFKIGALVDVEIQSGTAMGIWVPISAIRSDGEDYLFVDNGGLAEKRYVTLAEGSDNLIRVEGINPGESIILKGSSNISEGTKIKASHAEGEQDE